MDLDSHETFKKSPRILFNKGNDFLWGCCFELFENVFLVVCDLEVGFDSPSI